MNQIFKPGQTVFTEASQIPCKIEQFIGSGGQGEVYQVDMSGKPMALKWYFKPAATS
ncbi:MAG TPA: hypothetical protein VJL89_00915 [Thermodesulfovibrionia bacterium]|nr:hypothetical protein [Thermodesulfovibrionia bacterium]